MLQNKKWFSFMATDQWIVFMNIMRILTFIGIGILIFVLIKEIETVKILGGACEYCISKTGCNLFCPN